MHSSRPVGWKYESWRHSLASKGISSGRKYDMSKLAEFTKANMLSPGPKTNVETYAEIRLGGFDPRGQSFKKMFPDGPPTIDVIPKRLQYAGQFKDLFPKTVVPFVEGSNETPGWTRPKTLVVKSYQRGDVVRALRRFPDGGVLVDPMSGNPDDVMMMRGDDPLYYEPWMMDFGSVMFVPRNPPIGVPRGKPLKLGVEYDDLEVVGPVERKYKPKPVEELPDNWFARKEYSAGKLGKIAAKKVAVARMVEDTKYPLERSLWIMQSPDTGGIWRDLQVSNKEEAERRNILAHRIADERDILRDDIYAMSAFPPEEKFGEFPVGRVNKNAAAIGLLKWRPEVDPNSEVRVHLPKGWFARKVLQ